MNGGLRVDFRKNRNIKPFQIFRKEKNRIAEIREELLKFETKNLIFVATHNFVYEP